MSSGLVAVPSGCALVPTLYLPVGVFRVDGSQRTAWRYHLDVRTSLCSVQQSYGLDSSMLRYRRRSGYPDRRLLRFNAATASVDRRGTRHDGRWFRHLLGPVPLLGLGRLQRGPKDRKLRPQADNMAKIKRTGSVALVTNMMWHTPFQMK